MENSETLEPQRDLSPYLATPRERRAAASTKFCIKGRARLTLRASHGRLFLRRFHPCTAEWVIPNSVTPFHVLTVLVGPAPEAGTTGHGPGSI